VLTDIVAHAREAAPAECCGLLVGAGNTILTAPRARNLSDNPNRFLLDPHDHVRALRGARSQGLDVIGFYHSHPHSAPEPSPTDIAEATYLDDLYLIVSLRGESPEIRLFRCERGSFQPVAVVGT